MLSYEPKDTMPIVREYFNYLLRSIDNKRTIDLPQSDLTEFIRQLDVSKDAIVKMVVATALLQLSHKQASGNNKKRTLSMEKVRSSPELHKTKSQSENVEKTKRSTSIHPEFYKCKSSGILIAIAQYTLNLLKESIRRDVIFAIMTKKDIDVDSLIDYAQLPIGDLKRLVADSGNIKDTAKDSLIHAFMLIAEILRDISASKLAHAIDPKLYIERCGIMIDSLQSMAPFYALREKYLTTCVAPMHQNETRKQINEQFTMNKSIIETMIQKLPDNKKPSQDERFIDDMEYDVFIHGKKYYSKIITTTRTYENKIYTVLMLNSCLFDVLSSNERSFSDKRWPERLNTLPSLPQITLRRMTGRELNDFTGSAEVTVSWMENGLMKTKVFTFNRREKKIIN